MDRTINFLFNLGNDKLPVPVSVAFLVDLSGSMCGEPLEQAKKALIQMLTPMTHIDNNDYVADEVTLFTFHTVVKRITPFVGKENFDFFKDCLFEISDKVFNDSGCTSLFDGVLSSLAALQKEARRDNEKFLIIFSDGGENSSKTNKTKIEKYVRKIQQGYVRKDEIIQIYNTYDLNIWSNIFEDIKTDEELIFKPDASVKIDNSSLSDEHKSILHSKHEQSKNPVKIFSVYYKWEDTSSRGKKILDDLSRISSGKVYETLTAEKITDILKDIFYDNILNEKVSVRSLLKKRLYGSSFVKTYPDDPNFFRIISVNYGSPQESKYYQNNLNIDNQPYKHSVFNFEIINNTSTKVTRGDYLDKNEDILIKIKQDLQRNIIETELPIEDPPRIVQNSFKVVFTFRAKDFLALSLVKQFKYIISDILQTHLGSVMAANYTMLILVDEWYKFEEDEKKLFAAFLSELKTDDYFGFFSVVLMSDMNCSPTNERTGYNNLKTRDYEDMIVEVLSNYNLNTTILDTISGEITLENRFFTAGAITINLNRERIVNSLKNYFINDFLLNIFNEEVFVPNESHFNQLNFQTQRFENEISFPGIHEKVRKFDTSDIYGIIDFKDVLNFSAYSKKIKVEFKYSKSIKNYEYYDEIEYIQCVLKDIKEYVELNASEKEITLIVDKNFQIIKDETIQLLRKITDLELYGNPDLSSPVQAYNWLKECKKKLLYYKNILDNKIKENALYKLLEDFKIKGINGEPLKDQNLNPDFYFQKLKSKLELLPLISATNTKYNSVSLFLAGGLLALIIGLELPLVSLSMLLIPAIIKAYGIYKIKTSRKQIKELLYLYQQTIEYQAKLKLFNDIVTKYKKYLDEVIDNIGDPDQPNYNLDFKSISRISESTYLHFFDIGTKTLSKVSEFENSADFHTSSFYKDITREMKFSNFRFESAISSYQRFKDDFPVSSICLSEILNENSNILKSSLPSEQLSIFPEEAFSKLDINLKMKYHIVKISTSKFILYQLQRLQNDDKEKIISVFDDKKWNNIIEKLNNDFNYFVSNREYFQKTLMVLWRDMALYHVWIESLKKIEGYSNMEESIKNIFDIWLRVYEPRRVFKKLLDSFISKKVEGIVQGVELWEFLDKYQKKDTFFKYINGWSFPSLYINQGAGLYPAKKSYYLCSANNHSDIIPKRIGININRYLGDHETRVSETKSNNTISFFSFVLLPVSDNSIPLVNDIGRYCDKSLKDQKNLWLPGTNVSKVKFPFK